MRKFFTGVEFMLSKGKIKAADGQRFTLSAAYDARLVGDGLRRKTLKRDYLKNCIKLFPLTSSSS